MEAKPDLSNYIITGPFTSDKKNYDISWNNLLNRKSLINLLEDGIPI